MSAWNNDVYFLLKKKKDSLSFVYWKDLERKTNPV